MKKLYEKLELEIIVFESEDVLTTSFIDDSSNTENETQNFVVGG